MKYCQIPSFTCTTMWFAAIDQYNTTSVSGQIGIWPDLYFYVIFGYDQIPCVSTWKSRDKGILWVVLGTELAIWHVKIQPDSKLYNFEYGQNMVRSCITYNVESHHIPFLLYIYYNLYSIHISSGIYATTVNLTISQVLHAWQIPSYIMYKLGIWSDTKLYCIKQWI